jgi:hypothetical protein
MDLVILAAGHGRRFGGLKQLAEVGAHGEALIDYTAIDAFSCGFEKIVLIVREEIEDELLAHAKAHWPAEIGREAIIQGGIAGTAQAVMSAAPGVGGAFGVANADDFYGRDALEQLHSALSAADDSHSLIGFRLADTVFSEDTVKRGVCRVGPDGDLIEIVEQKVTALPGGGGFAGSPIDTGSDGPPPRWPLSNDEIVSMNLWGFRSRMFDHLGAAIADFDPPAPEPGENPPELLLPDVVKDLVAGDADRFRALEANGQCIGITHQSDLDFVRRAIGGRRPGEMPAQL